MFDNCILEREFTELVRQLHFGKKIYWTRSAIAFGKKNSLNPFGNCIWKREFTEPVRQLHFGKNVRQLHFEKKKWFTELVRAIAFWKENLPSLFNNCILEKKIHWACSAIVVWKEMHWTCSTIIFCKYNSFSLFGNCNLSKLINN